MQKQNATFHTGNTKCVYDIFLLTCDCHFILNFVCFTLKKPNKNVITDLICLFVFEHRIEKFYKPRSDIMDLYLCLPLLVVLLQPALCTYNCSSDYERTPGSFISFSI